MSDTGIGMNIALGIGILVMAALAFFFIKFIIYSIVFLSKNKKK